MKTESPGGGVARLVVNADDFGYSPAISRGIVECARQGIVTSTGVFGNAPRLPEMLAMLEEAPGLETGMHLALSFGAPLTAAMGRALVRHGGRFPGKFGMAALISRGRVGTTVLRDELRAQADACLAHGMSIAFLNAHEHLHLHPRVLPIVCELAHDLGVRFVRLPQPDVVGGGGLGGFVRAWVIRMLAPGTLDGFDCGVRFVGLARSGRIDFPYLEALLARLEPGRAYELMCHPGHDDPVLGQDRRLRAYHAWDQERRALQDSRLPALLHRGGIALSRFSEIATAPCGRASRPLA